MLADRGSAGVPKSPKPWRESRAPARRSVGTSIGSWSRRWPYGSGHFLCLRLVGRTSVTCLVIAGRRRLSPWSRMGSPVAGRDRVSGRRPPGRRLEGAGELLRLVGYQIGGDLHDAHSGGGRPVISDHDVAHPQVATARMRTRQDRWPGWVWRGREAAGKRDQREDQRRGGLAAGLSCQDGGVVSADGRRMLLLTASAGRWGLWLSRRSGSPGCCGSCAGRPG